MESFRHLMVSMRSISEDENGLGRNTLHRESVGHLRRREALKHGVISFSWAE